MRKRQKSEKAPPADFQSDLQIVHLTTALEAEKQSQEEIQGCWMPPVAWLITEDRERNGCDILKIQKAVIEDQIKQCSALNRFGAFK